MQNRENHGRLISEMKKYRFLLLAIMIFSFASLTILLWRPLVSFASNPEILRVWMQEIGIWGIVIFGIFNFLQVVFAVIPGGPFELAAGYVFGVLPGTLLCDITMTVSSAAVFLLVRKFGIRFVELFISRRQIEDMKFLQDNQKVQSVLFFIFLLPGTPKDVVTYLAGLTKVSLKSWIFICFVGRFPAILLTALGGSALGAAKYGIVAGVIVAFAVAYLAGMRLYRNMSE